MAKRIEAAVGQWYAHRDKGEMFRVVAVDGAAGVIEIQLFDGDVEELDTDDWLAMDIEAVEAPEDWTGPYDEIETDDLGYTETAVSPQDWRASLETLPAAEDRWQQTRTTFEFEEELAQAMKTEDAED